MTSERPKLKPETARRLSEALDGLDGRKAELRATRDVSAEAVVAAADKYLDARDEMGAVAKLVVEETGEGV